MQVGAAVSVRLKARTGYDALLAVAPQRRLSVALRISDDRVCSPGTMRKPFVVLV
jgi:hypothetical protein